MWWYQNGAPQLRKGVAGILDWGEAQTTNHTGEDQEKRSSQSDLGFFIGGPPKFSSRAI